MLLIGVDAGHGGGEHGCQVEGFCEKTFNLYMARKLMRLLPFAAISLRDCDEDMSPTDRAEKARCCDLVIHIHANTNPNPGVKGIMTFVKDQRSIASAAALQMQEAAPICLQTTRGVFRSSPATWTHRTYTCMKLMPCPSILVEAGCVTNKEDLQALKNPHVQEGLAAAMLVGVCTYTELLHG